MEHTGEWQWRDRPRAQVERMAGALESRLREGERTLHDRAADDEDRLERKLVWNTAATLVPRRCAPRI